MPSKKEYAEPEKYEVKLEKVMTRLTQVVLTLEDLARMVERGIYDLSTYIAGIKMLPSSVEIPKCFIALGFSSLPENIEAVKKKYKQLCKAVHPDAGGNDTDFVNLTKYYEECLSQMEEEK